MNEKWRLGQFHLEKTMCPSSYVVSNVNWCPQNCITSFLQMIDWTGKARNKRERERERERERRKKMKEAIKEGLDLMTTASFPSSVQVVHQSHNDISDRKHLPVTTCNGLVWSCGPVLLLLVLLFANVVCVCIWWIHTISCNCWKWCWKCMCVWLVDAIEVTVSLLILGFSPSGLNLGLVSAGRSLSLSLSLSLLLTHFSSRDCA